MQSVVAASEPWSILAKKLTLPDGPYLQRALFRIKRHQFSDLFAESRCKLSVFCTSELKTAKLLAMNTYEKKRVGHRQPFGELSKDTKGFRITSLSRNAKQLPWNDIVAEKPGGRGVLKFNLKFAMWETHRQPINRLC